MTETMRSTRGRHAEDRPDAGGADASARAERRAPVKAARVRRSAAVPRTAAIVLGIVLVGLAVVAGQEAAATSGMVSGMSPEDGWVTTAAQGLDGAAVGTNALLAGAVALVVGLLLLWAAWHSGPRYVRLQPAPAVVLRPNDVARLASSTAADVDGVLGASSTASARRVTVRVSSTGAENVPGDVERAVTRRLGLLERPPSVHVRVRREGET